MTSTTTRVVRSVRHHAMTGLVVLTGAAVIAIAMFASLRRVEGNGATQDAPDTTTAGVPIPIRLELSTVGSLTDIKGRYTDLRLYYRLRNGGEYQTVLPALISSERQRERYEFLVPPYPPGTRGELEYYIELALDGVSSRLKGAKRIAINGE